jgi:hypothetical protein
MYRIVLFDQGGRGRSTPHASEPEIDLSTNTTQHLLTDIGVASGGGWPRWPQVHAFACAKTRTGHYMTRRAGAKPR